MKKVVSFLLICLMAAGLLSGCKHDGGGTPGTVQEAKAFYDLAPDDLVAEALRRFDALESWSYQYDTTVDYSFFGKGPNVVLLSSGDFARQPLTMHGSFSVRPEEAQSPTEYYIREVDASDSTVLEFAMRRSVPSGTTADADDPDWLFGKWSKRDPSSDPRLSQEPPLPSAWLGKDLVRPYDNRTGTELLAAADNIWRFLAAGEHFQREDRETVNGRLAVRFSGTVSGEALYHLLNYSGVLGSGVFYLHRDDTPVQAGIPITLWIDADTVLPLRIEADFSDLMKQELNVTSVREECIHALLSMPGETRSLEEMLAQWDAQVRYSHGSVRIDLKPEPCEIVIPEKLSAGMTAGK